MSHLTFQQESFHSSLIEDLSILSIYGEPTNGETVLQQMEKYNFQIDVVDTSHEVDASIEVVNKAIEETTNHLRELLALREHIEKYKGHEKKFSKNLDLPPILDTVVKTQNEVGEATKNILDYKAIKNLQSAYRIERKHPTSANTNENMQEEKFKQMNTKIIQVIEIVTQRLFELDSLVKFFKKGYSQRDDFIDINLVLTEIGMLFQDEFRKYSPITNEIQSRSLNNFIKLESVDIEIKDPEESIVDTFGYCQEIIKIICKQSIVFKNQILQIDQGGRMNFLTRENMIQVHKLNGAVNETFNCVIQAIGKIKTEMQSKGMTLPPKKISREK